MKFQLKKGTIEIASEKLIFSPKNIFIQRVLALLFDKKTGESNTFIDNLTKKNLSIKVIEKLSDSTNFCRESCCYYKNE